MWTEITRPKYEREGQRYASDQVGALNGRLPLGAGGQDLHRIAVGPPQVLWRPEE